MGAVRDQSEYPDATKATLRREAGLPIGTVVRRPCSVVGIAVAMVFVAAMLDAALWNSSMDRQQLQGELGAANAHIESLEADNKLLRQHGLELEVRLLGLDLRELELQLLGGDLREVEAGERWQRWRKSFVAGSLGDDDPDDETR